MADKIDDEELLAILQQEAEDAIGYYNSEVANEQEQALKYYFGDPFGDEVEGRSTVVSRDVAETVDWIMPDLMRVFTQGHEAVKYEPQKPDDEAFAEQATDYANHVFFSDNKGQTILQDFAFDGLVQKLGVVRVDWQEPEHKDKESYEGLSVQQVMQLESDPLIEIIEFEAETDETGNTQVYPDGMIYEVSIRRRDECGRVVISAIPPEEFLVSRLSTDIDTARYVAHRSRKTRSELVEMYPDMADEIDAMPADTTDDTMDTRSYTRFEDEGYINTQGPAQANRAQHRAIFYDEYYLIDMDGDGVAELRNIKRTDYLIFENEEVSFNPFAAWSPIRVAHKLYGLSLADKTMDIQRINSVLLRSALDSTYLSVNSRYAVNDGPVNIDDLLSVRPGGVVRVSGNPADHIMPMTTPNQSGDALNMLEYMEQKKEARTGVSRHTQGLDPDSLNKTATGIQLIQNAGAAQKELIARNMAEGVEMLFRKILKVIVMNQDGPRTIQLTGKWVQVDPRSWNADMKVSVHVGLGTGSRETQLGYLNVIKQTQEQILLQAGPNNPIVTMENYYNTLSRMAETAGFRSAEPFFTDPADAPPQQPQQQPPDPKMIEVQQKGQLAQAQMQQDAQIKTAQMQQDAQVKQAQMAQDGQLKAAQLNAELQMKAQQMQAEVLLKQWQMSAELGLSEQQTQIEAALAKYGIEVNAALKVHTANVGAQAQVASAKIGSDVRLGGEVG